MSAENGDGGTVPGTPGSPARSRAGAGGAGGGDPASEGLDAGASPLGLRTDPPMLVAQLLDAITALDEDRAHAVLDTAFVERSVESAIIDVLLPLFVRVGEMWELGRIGIAQEHFASSLVRRRLGALSLTWGVGNGPVAVLACPPGEFHDIVLLSFGVLLGRAGWRIRYLGPDTPVHSLAAAARLTQADAVVLACRRPSGFRAHAPALRRLGEEHPVWIAGRGATPRVLEEVGVRHLGADLVAAVAELTTTARERRSTGAECPAARAPRAEDAAEREDAVTASGTGAKNGTRPATRAAGTPSRPPEASSRRHRRRRPAPRAVPVASAVRRRAGRGCGCRCRPARRRWCR